MKKVENLSSLECEWLRTIEGASCSSFYERRRAQSIRLSFQGFSISQIAEIHKVHRDTVSIWLKQWEEQKFEGLQDKAKKGRPLWLPESEHSRILKWVQKSPRQSKIVLNQIKEHFQRKMSQSTLKRILKKTDFHGKG